MKKKDYLLIENFVDSTSLKNLRTAFSFILDEVATKHYEKKNNFKNALHEKILYFAKKNKQVLTESINVFMNSAIFTNFFNKKFTDKVILSLFTGANPNDLIITEKNFRVDLPQSYTEEKKKFSLGWHQESGYFDEYVSHHNGWVIWLPLFKCGTKQGSLMFIEGSSKHGCLQHKKIVLDKIRKKNVRKIVPKTFINKYNSKIKSMEVPEGACSAFHFNTVHTSGINQDEDYARLTIQARVSLLSDEYFKIKN